jgi:hypothetical protein
MLLLIAQFLRNGLKQVFKALKLRFEATGYSGPAVLLFDGCSAHDRDYFWDACLRSTR